MSRQSERMYLQKTTEMRNDVLAASGMTSHYDESYASPIKVTRPLISKDIMALIIRSFYKLRDEHL